jgi:hypothetical protein
MIKEHKANELDLLGDEWNSDRGFRPGDRVGWFFGVKAHGVVISTSPCGQKITVLWSVAPRQPPFIDEKGNLHTTVKIPLERPVEWVSISLTVDGEGNAK